MLTFPAGAGALDYSACRYGASKALFRGPERDLTGTYLAALGGSVTFGKYVAQPYPALVEQALGLPVANLGGLNAGPDFYISDSAALAVAAGARATLIQVTGAEALTNPLYTVHSRRNDRFLGPTPALRTLYPEVDFTEIHFTRHLLQVLHRTDAVRFDFVTRMLQESWVSRMRKLLPQLPRPVLFWLVADKPDQDPLLITRAMVAALAPLARIVTLRSRPEGTEGMCFPETEALQAACLPGPMTHARIAAALVGALRRRAGVG